MALAVTPVSVCVTLRGSLPHRSLTRDVQIRQLHWAQVRAVSARLLRQVVGQKLAVHAGKAPVHSKLHVEQIIVTAASLVGLGLGLFARAVVARSLSLGAFLGHVYGLRRSRLPVSLQSMGVQRSAAYGAVDVGLRICPRIRKMLKIIFGPCKLAAELQQTLYPIGYGGR